MKRIMLLLAALCILFLQPGRLGLAQEKESAKAPPQKEALKAAGWVKLADGVEVLRLFGTRLGPQKPEIAILRLSDAQHEVFVHDPMKFLEEHRIYPFGLRRVVPACVPPGYAKAPPKDPNDDWAVVLFHMLDCTVAYLDSSAAEY